jgi:trimethylamine--corrinoid protein Co-methyltransferase
MDILPLGTEGIERIHQNSLKVLRETGIRLRHAGARHLLEASGAIVDHESEIVKLPEGMVLDAIHTAPHIIQLNGRDGSSCTLGKGYCYNGSADNKLNVFDYSTKEIRKATYQDVTDFACIAEALPGLSIVVPSAYANDFPSHLSELYTFEALFTHTSKHCQIAPMSLSEVEMFYQIAQITAKAVNLSPETTISLYVSTISPLGLDEETSNIIIYAAEHRIPLITLAGPITGVTSPLTLAGTLTIQNAENLFLITMAQLYKPGTPIVYGATMHIGDMRTGGLAIGGSAEYPMLSSSTSQLAKYYNLPSYTPIHNLVDYRISSQQASAMKMLAYVIAHGSGLDFTIGSGFFAPMITSFEQLVIDEALWNIVHKYFTGIEVNKDTLALETIQKVGPGGHYLTTEHTLRWLGQYRKSQQDVLGKVRLSEKGDGLLEAAHEVVNQIRNKRRSTVSSEVNTELQTYIQETRRAHATNQ